jgi:hypothetical protein
LKPSRHESKVFLEFIDLGDAFHYFFVTPFIGLNVQIVPD